MDGHDTPRHVAARRPGIAFLVYKISRRDPCTSNVKPLACSHSSYDALTFTPLALSLFFPSSPHNSLPTPSGVTTLQSRFHPDIAISDKDPGICETMPGAPGGTYGVPPAPPHECYLWVMGRCSEEEKEAVLDGTAIVKDLIVVGSEGGREEGRGFSPSGPGTSEQQPLVGYA